MMLPAGALRVTLRIRIRPATRRHALDDVRDELDDVGGLGVERGGAGVKAGDFQQVGQERLEAFHLVVEQLRGALVDGVEVLAGVIKDFGGHAHRGERGAELVGDVGDEPLLHLGQRGQLGDLFLEAGGHVVERGARAGRPRPRP